ncbi:phytanoyl-CoA dioxygenase family protein [Piscirickettsia litoralis]|uniref:Phytanoyl-CoA dioxygenase n=1 Tax=Piscirickettsia litoralis TaxID=1891921 RepID=A0ABX3A4F2_9GAMM|nr:phytanoyl-CoA dioxygenase family protein [Piscirickettsia litoralis]ODN43744.1 hypothetical protein BGC07_13620 [Piscirickettsia litoralis]
MKTLESSKLQLENNGWLVVENVFSKDEVDLYKELIDRCEVTYQPWQDYRRPGIFHHLPLTDYRFLTVLEKIEDCNVLSHYFNNNQFILNSFGGVINNESMDKNIYIKEIHRDINVYIKDYPLMINVLVMLDSFSKLNGAIEILPGSHKVAGKPEVGEFERDSLQVLSNAGSILFFNSYIWHRAGISQVLDKRRALTLTYTQSYFKQQADYSEVFISLPTGMKNKFYKKILGRISKVPKSLDEWYMDYEK